MSKILIDRAVVQQALEFLEAGSFVYPTQLATDLRAALAQEQPEPVQEPSYEPKFFDTVLYTGSSERATPVKPAPAGWVGVVPITTVSSVTSVPTQPYRVLTDADLDAIRKIVREGEEK